MVEHGWSADGAHVSTEPRPRRFRRSLLALEVGLWVAAVAMLGWVAWTVVDARRYQARAEETLATAEVVAEGPVWERPIDPGTPLAKLSVPRLELSVVVAEGVSSDVLRRAVGRIEGSALPGEPGNIAIAGHRDTLLRPLEGVVEGDEIVLESAAGRHVYRVEAISIVDPSRTDVLEDAGYPALTLITCYPFRYVGPAPERFIVRARRLDAGHETSIES